MLRPSAGTDPDRKDSKTRLRYPMHSLPGRTRMSGRTWLRRVHARGPGAEWIVTSCAPAPNAPSPTRGTDSLPQFRDVLSRPFCAGRIKAHTLRPTSVFSPFTTVSLLLSPFTLKLPTSWHHSHPDSSSLLSLTTRITPNRSASYDLRPHTTSSMTHIHECLVMPPLASTSLPPTTQLCHSRTGLASEPLRPPEARDALVPFPCSDERMSISGGAPHKDDDSAQRQPPNGTRTRRRTIRRKKSSLGLREDFLKSSEDETSPTAESPEQSPVEPAPAQSES
ncbi:hypothetical protein GSI_13091 [Ganoderma sinense ZZ0214-1]|uniref:Uncharacterized protein n=1 Tax=Ganoderma sinense ZZ0214-1 TaxID=1077348 RepID=A0A2G8RUK5_9APHY|nr:hypothetical protein GSI_13091 [Ganoderma sinense ZZ0214-1]